MVTRPARLSYHVGRRTTYVPSNCVGLPQNRALQIRGVREAIGVGPGDRVAYDVGKGIVTLRRLEPIDLAFHAAVESTLAEWGSKEDDEAYGDL